MTERENFFILLNLHFDPPETDEASIREAIGKFKKRIQQGEMSPLPEKKLQAAELRLLLPEMEKTMMDRGLREQEAILAQRRIKSAQEELQEELTLISGKGFVTPEELNLLVKKYAPYGMTKQLIQRTLMVPLREGKNADGAEIALPESVRKELEHQLSIMNYRYRTIYQFLHRTESDQTERLLAATKEKQKMIRESVAPTAEDLASNRLCDVCIKIFADEATRTGYDAYLKTNRFLQLSQQMTQQAAANGNEMTPAMKRAFVTQGRRLYNDISEQELQTYIDTYCRAKGIHMSVPVPSPKPPPAPTPVPTPTSAPVEDIARKRAQEYVNLAKNAIKVDDPKEALQLLNRALKEDPICGEAYIVSLMLEAGVNCEDGLAAGVADLKRMNAWQNAMQYSDSKRQKELENYAKKVDHNILVMDIRRKMELREEQWVQPSS